MHRPAVSVARAHRGAPVPVLPSMLLAAVCPAAAAATARAYSFEPEPPTWLERVTEAAAAHNRRVRLELGLEWADNRLGSWYPEAAGALEARSLDGDR